MWTGRFVERVSLGLTACLMEMRKGILSRPTMSIFAQAGPDGGLDSLCQAAVRIDVIPTHYHISLCLTVRHCRSEVNFWSLEDSAGRPRGQRRLMDGGRSRRQLQF